ncbi:hypothetical protein [Clostridium tetani]|uniref:Uncharacterized protein n=1 Tax=Clostridium tetani TaxID=1513 RepID=A0ABY0EUS3_CLOTA|nr:hypothetical protein [Clostridium tetani]CDI48698.1 hypothetical protein BN906_00673 [Clostridium tetani 12124569]KHO39973.1 hypothetical protein OR62_03110 [Clostridium tetani]RXI42138.1 hypothetical protein DP129_00565 [Clostridium tetani]RXI57941.1 hypothetical protein DP131_03130 [Clostridium tetani]RXI73017.1 hypothetical protein DQN76_03475 [Clostridium tetani]
MSFGFIIAMFVILSIIIDVLLMKYVKKKLSGLFGLQLTITGLFCFYIVWNATFYKPYSNIIPYFISVYFIVTGLIIGYRIEE